MLRMSLSRVRRANLVLIAMLGCITLAACGTEDAVTESPTPTTPTASEELDLTVEASRLRSVLADLRIDASGLKPMRWDTTNRLLAFPVSARDALATWQTLRANLGTVRRWPLVVQAADDVLGNVDAKEYPGGPAGVIAGAVDIDPIAWMRERERGDPEYYGDVPKGEWVDAGEGPGWAFPKDYKGNPAEGLVIALVPTLNAWEVPAWFYFGGWNECPPPSVHVAVQKRWHRLYGAEIVFLDSDVIEMACPRLPASRDAARALAREQFLYSGGDLIHQGYGEMDKLASALRLAKVWYFWWD